jgi:catechol 2,3-dioxygenase-like lactoylglutathione lyase family enzyme
MRKFDHLVLAANDLDRQRDFYARMGFTLTPRAQHPFGTANSLVQLQGNFLELLSVADPAAISQAAPGSFSFGAYNQAFLERREGFSMLVLASRDAAADAAEFKRLGLDAYDLFKFGREATLPDGSKARVDFSLAFVTEPSMPEAVFFTCQQHAPQYFWRPEYQRHANGALRIAEVVMSAGDPARYQSFFTRLMGNSAALTPEGLTVAGGGEQVTVLTHDSLAQRYPEIGRRDAGAPPRFEAYAIEVEELGVVKALLAKASVPFRATGPSLIVPPSAAFNLVIEFTSRR